MSLTEQECTACRPDAPPATPEEIEGHLKEIPDWQIKPFDGVRHLVRTYEFKDFANALRFTVQVGEAADEVGHHPTLITVYGKVTVHWWTHAIGDLHKNDFIMAARTDQIYNELSG